MGGNGAVSLYLRCHNDKVTRSWNETVRFARPQEGTPKEENVKRCANRGISSASVLSELGDSSSQKMLPVS